MPSSNPVTVIADRLARRAEYIEMFPEAEKRAFDLQSTLSGVKDYAKANPGIVGGLAGAGLGAAAGYGSSLFADKEDQQPWQSALTGGAAGAAIGGGLGLAYQSMPTGINKLVAEPGKPNIADAANKMDYRSGPNVPTSLSGLLTETPATTATGVASTGIAGKMLYDSSVSGTPGESLRAGLTAALKGVKPENYTPAQEDMVDMLAGHSNKQLRAASRAAGPTGTLNKDAFKGLLSGGKEARRAAARIPRRGKLGLAAAAILGATGLANLGESSVYNSRHNRAQDSRAKQLLEQYAKAGKPTTTADPGAIFRFGSPQSKATANHLANQLLEQYAKSKAE